MNKLALLCVMILLFSVLFTQTYASSMAYQNATDSDTWGSFNGSFLENGSSTGLEGSGYEVSAGFDIQTGFLAMLVGFLALVAVMGITVLGSGLKDFSVKALWKAGLYITLWTVLSTFALEGYLAIPIFGWVVYFLLTGLYMLGILEGIM